MLSPAQHRVLDAIRSRFASRDRKERDVHGKGLQCGVFVSDLVRDPRTLQALSGAGLILLETKVRWRTDYTRAKRRTRRVCDVSHYATPIYGCTSGTRRC